MPTNGNDLNIYIQGIMDTRNQGIDAFRKSFRQFEKLLEQKGYTTIKLKAEIDLRKFAHLKTQIKELQGILDSKEYNIIKLKVDIDQRSVKKILDGIRFIQQAATKNIEVLNIQRLQEAEKKMNMITEKMKQLQAFKVSPRSDGLKELRDELQRLYGDLYKGEVEISKITRKIDESGVAHYQYKAAVKQSGDQVREFKGIVNGATGVVQEQDKALKKASSSAVTMGQRFKTALQSAPVWMGAMSLIYGPIHGLQNMISTIIEVDTQLTEMKKVMDQDTNFDQVLADNIKMANELGKSLTSVNKAYIEFARQGKSAADAAQLTKAAMVATNISELSDEEAINDLTAAITQFHLKSSDAMKVLDEFNQVDNNFATSTRDIANAVSEAGSTAYTYGVTLEQMIGYITAISEATHDTGNVIGNSLKSIFSRLTTKESEKALKEVGIQIRDNNGQLKKGGDIINELAAKWGSLTSEQKQNIGVTIAGRYQLSRFLALMNNFDTAQRATETALHSTGSAMQENERYQQSLQARIERLKVAWESLAVAAGDAGLTDDFIYMVQGATSLINALKPLIQEIGLIPMLTGAVSTALVLMNNNIKTAVLEVEILQKAFKALRIESKLLQATLASSVVGLLAVGASFIIEKLISANVEEKQKMEETQRAIDEKTNAYREHRQEIDELVNRYDQLSKKTNLSAAEQQELADVQNKLNQIMPQFTEYVDSSGNAHLFNATAIKEETSALKELAKEKDRQKLKDLNNKREDKLKELDDYRKKIEELRKQLENGDFTKTINVKGEPVDIPLTGEELEKARTKTQREIINNQKLMAQGMRDLNNITMESIKLNLQMNDTYKHLSNTEWDLIQQRIQISNNMTLDLLRQKKITNEQADKELKKTEDYWIRTASEMAKKKANLGGALLGEDLLKYVNNPKINANTKKQIDLFKSGKITVAQFRSELQKMGVTESDVDKIINNLNSSLDDQHKHVSNLDDLAKKLKSLFDNYADKVGLVNDAIGTLNNGQQLSLKQVFDLLAAYPQLFNAMKVQNGYVTFNKQSLQELINVQEDQLKAQLLANKIEIEQDKKRLEAKRDTILQELGLYDMLGKARAKNIEQLAKEVEAETYNKLLNEADPNKVTENDIYRFEMLAKARAELIRNKGKEIAEINKAIGSYDEALKGIDKAMNIDFSGLSNPLESVGEEMKKQIYIVDEYANKLGDLETRLKEIESLQKRYPQWSKQYREALAKEIELIKQKLKLVNQERADLAQQIKTGNIKPTGLVDVSEYGGGASGSASVADYYLNSGKFRLTSRYGDDRGDHKHMGIDLAAAIGTAIKSAMDGVVVRKGYQKGGAGNYIVIRDAAGNETKYMHMRDQSFLKVGQRVSAGDVIGYVGNTGHSTGAHLHFEVVLSNGQHVDPLQWLQGALGGSSGVSASSAKWTGKYADIINKASAKYGVDPFLIAAIIQQESSWNPNILGPKTKYGRAKGLMQLIDSTAKSLGVTDPFDPYQNIMGGTKYLAQLLKMFGGDVEKAIAAYNAGPGNVKKYGGIPPFHETQDYVRKVEGYYQKFSAGKGSYGSGYSEAERMQDIDQAKQKKRGLDQDAIELQDQLRDLTWKSIESMIEQYKWRLQWLDDWNYSYKFGQDVTDDKTSDKYRYYLEKQAEMIQMKMSTQKSLIEYIESQIKNTNPYITPAMKQQLQDMHREAKNALLDLQKELKELKDQIAESKLNELIENIGKAYDEASDKIDHLDKQLQMVDEKNELDQLKLLNAKKSYYEDQLKLAEENIQKLKDIQKELNNNPDLIDRANEEMKKWQKTLDDVNVGLHDINKQIEDVHSRVADDVINVLKEMYEKQRDLELKALDDQQKALEDAHDKKMKMWDEEMQKYEDLTNQMLKKIDNEEEQSDYQKQLNKLQEEKRKLQEELNKLSLDNSLEGRARVKDIQEELKQKQEEIDDFVHKHEVEQRKKSLQDQLDDKKKQLDKQKEAEDNAMEEAKKNYDKLREDINKKWENMLEDQRRFEKIRKDIIAGNIDEIKKELDGFIDYIGKHTADIGESISNNLLDKIKEVEDSLKDIYNWHNPSKPSAPGDTGKPYDGKNPNKDSDNDGIPDWVEDALKRRQSKLPTLKKGDQGDMVKWLQKRLGIAVTGIYGEETESALMNWQRAHGFQATGIADDYLLRALGYDTKDGRFPILVYKSLNDPEWVKKLQKRLGVKQTGTFDDLTLSAVKNWQKAHGFADTGVVDDTLWRALGFNNDMYQLPILSLTTSGEWVKKLQELLKMTPTGYFDQKTLEAVKAWQRLKGLKETGIVDDEMWASLGVKDPLDEWSQVVDDFRRQLGKDLLVEGLDIPNDGTITDDNGNNKKIDLDWIKKIKERMDELRKKLGGNNDGGSLPYPQISIPENNKLPLQPGWLEMFLKARDKIEVDKNLIQPLGSLVNSLNRSIGVVKDENGNFTVIINIGRVDSKNAGTEIADNLINALKSKGVLPKGGMS